MSHRKKKKKGYKVDKPLLVIQSSQKATDRNLHNSVKVPIRLAGDRDQEVDLF